MGLYNLEMISLQRCNFQIDRLAYDSVAQKARKETEAKMREKAKKRRLIKKKKKKKRLEYLQQLWDEVLAGSTTLLEGTEGSQIVRSKYKKVTSGNKEGQ